MPVVPVADNTSNVPNSAFSVLKIIFPFFLSIFICKYTITQNTAAALATDTMLARLIFDVIFRRPNNRFIIQINALTYSYTVLIGFCTCGSTDLWVDWSLISTVCGLIGLRSSLFSDTDLCRRLWSMLERGSSLEDDSSANFFFITRDDFLLPRLLYGRLGRWSFVLSQVVMLPGSYLIILPFMWWAWSISERMWFCRPILRVC